MVAIATVRDLLPAAALLQGDEHLVHGVTAGFCVAVAGPVSSMNSYWLFLLALRRVCVF